jgi:hypothetical protein|uniref:Transmembrane protein n=1 Tax=Zea mays TaxID=4577 RepID=C4J3S2_MAIZE|nr:unknown [Zea mays]
MDMLRCCVNPSHQVRCCTCCYEPTIDSSLCLPLLDADVYLHVIVFVCTALRPLKLSAFWWAHRPIYAHQFTDDDITTVGVQKLHIVVLARSLSCIFFLLLVSLSLKEQGTRCLVLCLLLYLCVFFLLLSMAFHRSAG